MREELNTKIGEFKANAPEYLNVASITDMNENITRANELRTHIIQIEGQRLELIRKKGGTDAGAAILRDKRDEKPLEASGD